MKETQGTQQGRGELNTLSLSEKIKKAREIRVASLLNAGYITPEEAEIYREPLEELPKDRKGLIVAYYLSGVESRKDIAPSLEFSEKIGSIIGSFRLHERGALKDGRTIADTLAPEERIRWASSLSRAHAEEHIKYAEDFVATKRGRIRKQLLKFVRLFIISSLAEDEEPELDPIPYLRDRLREHGYQPYTRSLSDTDKEAIEEAASYYLDLLELAFLTGLGIIRREEYKRLRDEKGAFREDFYYRDELDEALTEYDSVYSLLTNAVVGFYADGSTRGVVEYLSGVYKKVLQEESSLEFLAEIRGSRFKSLLEEK